MPKANPLSKALADKAKRPKTQSITSSSSTPPARSGKVMIGAWFSPAVQRQVRKICFEEEITLQALMTDALNAMFAKRKMPEIAGLSSDGEAA